MSGHSKWAQIKRQKAVTDKKKGAIFTKLGYAITIAAKQGGGDPAMNFKLRLAIDKAKAANMPNDNIERAILKGTGGGDGATFEEVVYEGFGPEGSAVIIEALTDSKNRTTSVVRNIFSKYGGNLGSHGSVNYLFNKKGVIRVLRSEVPSLEKFELAMIDAGADDIIEEEEGLTILTSPEKLSAVKGSLEKSGVKTESADIEMVSGSKISLPDQAANDKLLKLLEELENCEDINNYFTNVEL
jgi:YebC/PmpR family DNA-binding regulatory protein